MLPGLASDERLLTAQRGHFPGLIVPEWPKWNDSIRDPKEFAQLCWNVWTVEKHIVPDDQPYCIGGTSVGGIIALEAAWLAHQFGKPPLAVLLISSCRSWQDVPRWYGRWANWSERLPKWIASKLFERRQIAQSLRSDAADARTSQLVEAMYQASDWGSSKCLRA